MSQIVDIVTYLMAETKDASAKDEYGDEGAGYDYEMMAFTFLEKLHDLKIIDADDLLRTMAREITDRDQAKENA